MSRADQGDQVNAPGFGRAGSASSSELSRGSN
jgi:hypothetical protein